MSDWAVLKDAPKWKSFRAQLHHPPGSGAKVDDCQKSSSTRSRRLPSIDCRRTPSSWCCRLKNKRKILVFETSVKASAAIKMAEAQHLKAQVAITMANLPVASPLDLRGVFMIRVPLWGANMNEILPYNSCRWKKKDLAHCMRMHWIENLYGIKEIPCAQECGASAQPCAQPLPWDGQSELFLSVLRTVEENWWRREWIWLRIGRGQDVWSAATGALASRFSKLGMLPVQSDSSLGCFRRDEWVEGTGLPIVA